MPVLGACISFPDLILVSQFMAFGSLFNVLHDQTEFTIDQNQSINFAIHIAKGMEFLHNLEPTVLNFHLNSKHIMVEFILIWEKCFASHCKKVFQS